LAPGFTQGEKTNLNVSQSINVFRQWAFEAFSVRPFPVFSVAQQIQGILIIMSPPYHYLG
jgi:hypothetical protein